MKDFWNERYKNDAFAYGEAPNKYFEQELLKLPTGKILLAAEGEGRNAVFAAQQGWDAYAFDWSEEARNKALLLAEKKHVNIEYQVGELTNLDYSPEQFDALALIFAHFSPEIKSTYHKELAKLLRSGGYIIFEAFSKRHLLYNASNGNVGGPRSEAMLFSIEELQHDFSNFDVIELEEKEIELKEGLYHNGVGMVIRFIGRKR